MQLATLGDSVRQNFRDFLALNHRLASARREAEAAAAGVRPQTPLMLVWTRL